MREMRNEERAFRAAWLEAGETEGAALLQIDDTHGFTKRAALFLDNTLFPDFTAFHLWALRAIAAIRAAALQGGFPWLLDSGSLTNTPTWLLDDHQPGKPLRRWINVTAAGTEAAFKTITTDAITAAAVWADALRQSSNPVLASVQMRGRYPTPAFDTRQLRRTDAENVGRRLLEQLRQEGTV
ncbi:MAG: hypothetical protein IK099_10370 [Clostridia bacterium]|nr:hypothetical protein [Clostridia bacterium]